MLGCRGIEIGWVFVVVGVEEIIGGGKREVGFE